MAKIVYALESEPFHILPEEVNSVEDLIALMKEKGVVSATLDIDRDWHRDCDAVVVLNDWTW